MCHVLKRLLGGRGRSRLPGDYLYLLTVGLFYSSISLHVIVLLKILRKSISNILRMLIKTLPPGTRILIYVANYERCASNNVAMREKRGETCLLLAWIFLQVLALFAVTY